MKRLANTLKKNWPAYFFEVLVITLGILGAFLLGNWNDYRKTKKFEHLTTERLIEDLQLDAKRFSFLKTRFQDRIDRCDSVLILLREQETEKDRLNIISIHLINYFLLETNTTTYDEMLNTGRIYSFKEGSIRNRIINYYQNIQKWGAYIEKDNAMLRDMVIQVSYNDYWSIQQQLWDDKSVSATKYPWLSQQHSQEMKNLEALVYRTRHIFQSNLKRVGFLDEIRESILTALKESE